MKRARFLFIVIGLGALTLASSYAGEPSRQTVKNERKDETLSKPREDGHSSAMGRQAGPPKSPPKLLPEIESHPPGLKKPATAAKAGPLTERTEKPREQPAKPPAGNAALAPRPGVVRNRGATAANVGRVLVTSNTRYSAGPLDGAALKRKP
jgi:hypothetical protein